MTCIQIRCMGNAFLRVDLCSTRSPRRKWSGLSPDQLLQDLAPLEHRDRRNWGTACCGCFFSWYFLGVSSTTFRRSSLALDAPPKQQSFRTFGHCGRAKRHLAPPVVLEVQQMDTFLEESQRSKELANMQDSWLTGSCSDISLASTCIAGSNMLDHVGPTHRTFLRILGIHSTLRSRLSGFAKGNRSTRHF